MSKHECKQHANCSNGHPSVDIYSPSEWSIVNDVLDMLTNGNAINPSTAEPIVEFKFPDELKVCAILIFFCVYSILLFYFEEF